MKDWQKAEEFFKELVDGWAPPGSGSKFRQGDILAGSWYLEVKHTSKPKITIRSFWLDVLIKHSLQYDVALCLSNPICKAVYYLESYLKEPSPVWKAKSFLPDDLPDCFTYKRTSWLKMDPKDFSEMIKGE